MGKDAKSLTRQELEIVRRTFNWASKTTAIAGDLGISPSEFKSNLEQIQETLDAQTRAVLTGRETQVLQKLADSAGTEDVARELGISPHTVKTHLYRIIKKLDAHNRAEAIAIAMREGFIH